MRKACIDRELTMEIIVGTFVLLAMLGLGIFTIVLSRERLFRPTYGLDVRFDDVMGLREGDDVVSRGMPIGRVSRLVFDNGRVLVHCSLNEPVALRDGYQIRIVSTSILGGHRLSVFEGPNHAPEVEGLQVAEGQRPADLVDEATSVIRDVRAALEQGGVLANLRSAAADMAALTAKLRKGEGSVGKLLNDEALYRDLQGAAANLKEISAGLNAGRGFAGKLLKDETLYEDVKAVAANLKEVTRRLNEGEGFAGKLLRDESLYADLRSTVAGLKDVTQRIASGKGSLGKLLSEDDQIYRDLADTVAALKGTAVDVQAGKGTLGKILKDEQLYQDVRALLKDAQGALQDMRENTPISTFASILFGSL